MKTLIDLIADITSAELELKQENDDILGLEIKVSELMTFSIFGKLFVEKTIPPLCSDEYVDYERGFVLHNVYLDIDKQSFYAFTKDEEFELEKKINENLR